MKCRLFRDLLDEYMDNEISETRREKMEDHARMCPDCKDLLQQRQRLFHRLTESMDPDWGSSLADSVMAEIRTMPIPHTANPMQKPLLIALITAIVISSLLMVLGLSSLPESISPVDVFKLMAGSIDMPSGLRSSIDELGQFLGASWVIIKTLVFVVVKISTIILLKIPVVVPLVILIAGSILYVLWFRRKGRRSTISGIIFSLLFIISIQPTFAAVVDDSDRGLSDFENYENLPADINITVESLSEEDSADINVTVTHEQNGDGIALFGSINVAPGEVRDGDLIIFGGNGVVAGEVDGALLVFGGNADVSGHITEDLVLFGGVLNLTSTAQIDGNLVSIGGVINREDGASVLDETVNYNASIFNRHNTGRYILWKGLLLFLLLTWLILGFLITLVFTCSIEATSISCHIQPLQSLLAGFIFHVAVMLSCLFMTIIIIGFPLALIGGIIWVCISIYGTVVGFILMGKIVMEKFGKGQSSIFAQMLLGFTILAIIRFLPFFIGWTVWQLWAMAGIGATLVSKFGSNKPWFQNKTTRQIAAKKTIEGQPLPPK